MTTIPRNALVLVADAKKALLFSNEGDGLYPALAVVAAIEAPANPPARDHGSDRPGRLSKKGIRSAVGQVDGHEKAESEFASRAAAALSECHRTRSADPVIIAAPPRFLGELRSRLPGSVRSKIIAEFAKDIANLPTHEIERRLSAQ